MSVVAAAAADSIALLAFGISSFVEVSSGAVLIWRLRAEKVSQDAEAIERLDRRARRLVGVSLWALAAYVAFEALRALWAKEEPRPTLVGMALTALSLAVMMWLGLVVGGSGGRSGDDVLLGA